MDRLCTDRKQYTNQSKLVGYISYRHTLCSHCLVFAIKSLGGGGIASACEADAEEERSRCGSKWSLFRLNELGLARLFSRNGNGYQFVIG